MCVVQYFFLCVCVLCSISSVLIKKILPSRYINMRTYNEKTSTPLMNSILWLFARLHNLLFTSSTCIGSLQVHTYVCRFVGSPTDSRNIPRASTKLPTCNDMTSTKLHDKNRGFLRFAMHLQQEPASKLRVNWREERDFPQCF